MWWAAIVKVGWDPVSHHEKLAEEPTFACSSQSHRLAMDMRVGAYERGR
jgi:hypothetical protein